MKTIIVKLAPLLLIIGWSCSLYSQTVTTTVGSVTICPGEITIPVNTTGFSGVGSFSMVLNVNPGILSYNGYQNINPALSNGNFVANAENGVIYISWYGNAAATITNGSLLLELKFIGYAGSSALTWDTQTSGNCEYTNILGQILPSTWVNGNAAINQPPQIITHPVDKLTYAGSNITFAVSATGTGLVYLWQVSTNGGNSWTNLSNGGSYSNTTTATLTISNTPLSLSGSRYRCKVSGTCVPFTYSDSALLTVTPIVNTICQSLTTCPGEIIVPVNVTDFIGVGAFSMALNINYPNLTYTGYQNLNPGLPTGTLTTNVSGGILYFSWYGTSGLTLSNGVLLELKFTAVPGTGSLAWDVQTPGNCEYSDVNGVVIFSNWVNGNITINQPPLISLHPADKTISAASNTTFSTTATGTGLSYIWQLSTDGGSSWFDLSNGGHYSNVTNTTLNISTVPLNWSGYQYRCKVTGTCSPVAYSNPALLTVTPLIITTCQSLTSCSGEITVPVTVTDFIGVGAFSLVLNINSPNLTYTGYQNLNPGLPAGTFSANAAGGVIYLSWYGTSGVTLTNGVLLELKFIAVAGSGSLTWDIQTPGNCEYSGANGQVIFSNWVNGTIAINQSPLITSQTGNKTIYAGGTTTFSVSVTGTGLNYQWQTSTNNGSNWSNLTNTVPNSGVSTTTLTISPVTTSMNGYLYRCYITGTCPPFLTSSSALLTVTQAAITTTISNISNICTGNLNIPVNVTNCVNVGGISLSLQFDAAKMSYEGYHTVNSELASGILAINQSANSVFLSWASTDPADIGTGTLVYLRFKANPGISTTLSWDIQTPGNCEYSDVYGTVISSFYNNAIITVASNALMVNAGNDLNTNPGNAVQLNGTASGGVTPYSYLWTPSDWLSNPVIPNPVATPLSTITYTLAVTANNCVGTDAIQVTVMYNLPQVTTAAISGITYLSAMGGGTVIDDGGAAVTARGVCWGIADAPTINDSHTTDGAGLGAFISSLTGLTSSKTYYVRAYATNSVGTAYGNQVSFTTPATPVNLPPTINPVPDPSPIAEDAGQQTINLSGISDGNPEFVQNISISAVSSNVTVIPNPIVNYTPNNTTGSLNYTPLFNAFGNSMITVTVMDNGGTENGGVNTTTTSFNVVVFPVNDPPFANAGPDQSTTTGSVVILDGSGSFDVEGNPLSYSWSAPAGIILSDYTAIHPTFTPPLACTNKTYIFNLTVNDGTVSSAPDYVSITVSAALPVINIRPLNLTDTLFSGNTSVQDLIIKNRGFCNLSVTLSDTVSWLMAQPGSGTIGSGDSVTIAVHFNATGLNAGLFSTAIKINSNDPGEPVVNIPVHLIVHNALDVTASANPPAICDGGTTQLIANATGGNETYSYTWSSNPPGFFSGLRNPVVNPIVNTNYFVNVSDGQGNASGSVLVTVSQNVAPSAVVNMLPANNTFDLQHPIHFSWAPSSNAISYDLYIWQTNQVRPGIPRVADMVLNSYTCYENLNTSYFYYWQVVAKNPCLQTQSEINVFSFNVFSDLTVSDIVIPGTAYSGKEFDISFKVSNIGSGGTGSSQWKDDVYLSSVPEFNIATAHKVGTLQNISALANSGNYTDSASIILNNYLEGIYYVFVKTDDLNEVQESNENNNIVRAPGTLNVMMPPYPDLWVRDVHAMAGSIVPDSVFSLGWIVENIGDGPAVGGWSQKVSLVAGTERRLLGYLHNNDSLAVSGILSQTVTFSIPKILGLEGDFYLEVELIPNPGLIEKPNGALNNLALSDNSTPIEKRLFFSIPGQTIDEESTISMLCKVFRSGKQTNELPVNLDVSEVNRISFPETVTILANQSGVVFYISAINNSLLEGNRELSILANASEYNETTDTLMVIDDEKASISVVVSSDTATEGNVVQVSVTRDLVSNTPLNVSVFTNKPSQIQIPGNLIIGPGAATTIINAVIIDDAVPELSQQVEIGAYAPGFTSGMDTITILDNDIPQISFTISPDSVSEAAGATAAWGKIQRLVPGSGQITMHLSSQPGSQVYFPSQIIMPGGTMESQFYIGVFDNALLDGNRVVQISATIFLASCNCGVPAADGGIVSANLTILDNDGPSLSMHAAPFVVPEGLINAGILTISRNTPIETALAVTIQNSDTTEIEVPATAQIPADQTYVEIPFNSIDDSINDGDQIIPITVSAGGFANGACWIMVSDRNLPDLKISGLQLPYDSVYTGDNLPITMQIINSGFATAPSGVDINVYLSKNKILDAGDFLISAQVTASAIAIGGTLNVADTLHLSGHVGQCYVIAVVNHYQWINELLYINNESNPIPLKILPDYNATASVNGDVFNGNTPIIITGSVETITHQPAPNKAVDIYIVVSGVRRELHDTSDVQGNFTVTFQPLNGEAGNFYVGACFPGQGLDDAQDEFIVTGMKYTGGPITWDMLLGVTKDSSIQIKNFSSVDLHGVTMEVVSVPPGCSLTFHPIGNLSGNETASMTYTLNATGVSEGTGYEQVKLKINSTEGSDYEFSANFKCKSPTGYIKTNPVTLVTTMVKGQSNIAEFEIQNIGLGSTGLLTINIPQVEWMSLVCPDTMSSIPPGGIARVSLRLAPTPDLPLNVPITGNIAINCANANNILEPFSIETISKETGDLSIDAVDEYTYYTGSGAHVDSAHVILRHPYSGVIIAEGITNGNGVFEVQDIPEGYYTLTVEATRHQGYQNNILIEKGQVNEETVFLSFQAITYSWNVVPKSIGDEYDVDLIVKYETNVPAPVVVINMPDTMPHLEYGENYPFIVTLTNIGLITANEVKLTLPEDAEYVFTCLVDELQILPQQSVQIPVVMERRGTQKSGSSLPCYFVVQIKFYFYCGPGTNYKWEYKYIKWQQRVCPGIGIPSNGNGTIYLVDPEGPPLIPIIRQIKNCNPCNLEVGNLSDQLEKCFCNNMPSGPSNNNSCSVNSSLTCVNSVRSTCASVNNLIYCNITLVGCDKIVLQGDFSNIKACFDALLNLCNSKNQGSSLGYLNDAQQKSIIAYEELMSARDWVCEVYNDSSWYECEDEEYNNFYQYFESLNPELGIQLTPELISNSPGNISLMKLQAFVDRWNNTIAMQNGLPFDNTNVIDLDKVSVYIEKIDSCENQAALLGYESTAEMMDDVSVILQDGVEQESNSVCATITLNFSQSLTMTREAFEGTLNVFNGHETTAMQNISLDLEIKDEFGVNKNDLFQINTIKLDKLTEINGSGMLDALQTGTAVVQFIPEKGAAPTLPKSYSFGGALSYLDPFTNQVVTRPLFPVTLQVNPSPDLYLSYFMQRDVFGDDALTQPIEPSIPAELAVMINNKGVGTANHVQLESAQPEIIDNEKGLLIDFQIIGSNLSGKPCNLGLNNVDFGDVKGGKIAIGQWLFTSSLLGHFVSYEATVNHLDSYGNQDLSLVSGIEIHELTHSISAYGALNDSINDFLVNDIPDAHDYPDILYFSNGTTADVFIADTSITDGPVTIADTIVEMTVTPSSAGWNYTRLADPGNGKYRIVSITRHVGQAIPLDNIWLTYCTIPDGGEPIYENKMHFADNFETLIPATYTIVFEPIDQDVPAVVAIHGIPENPTQVPVDTVRVVFSEPIEPSTFTYKDMVLKCQGGANMMDSLVSITQINDTVFRVNISAKTTASGYYVLTVQTTGITDLVGNHGVVGRQGAWIQTIPITNAPITGPDTVCVGTSGVTYSIQSGMTTYIWSISSGGTIMSGAGTNTITVNWTAGGTQLISVNYTSVIGSAVAELPVTVYPLFVVGSIAESQAICYNSPTSALAGTAPTGGNNLYSYQWQSSTDNVNFTNLPGATSLNYSPPPLTLTTYYREIQSTVNGCGILITNVVTITVYPQFFVGSVASSQVICYNTAPAVLTGTAPTGGNNPYYYQWQRSTDNVNFTNITGGTSLDYSPPALTSTTYYRQVQSSSSDCGTLTTNVVTITVHPQFVVGSIDASQVICYNTVPIGLNGFAPIGGSMGYTYQWQHSTDNVTFTNISGATSLNYSPPALTVTTYYRQVQTSAGNCGSVTTNVVTITVYPQFVVGSVSTNQLICYNTFPFAITGYAPTGGNAPYHYQWQHSSDNVTFTTITGATSLNYSPPALTSTTFYRQVQYSSSGCGSLTTNVVTITVYQQFAVGSIAASQIICYNVIPAPLTGIAPTGGNNPFTYQWQSSTDNVYFTNIAGATMLNYSPPALTSTTYYRQVQYSASGCGSLTTNVVTISVYPQFLMGSIAPRQIICYNATPAGLAGTAPTGGNNPFTYQWQVSIDNVDFTDITGATSLNYAPPALTLTTYYRQVQTSASACGSLATNAVSITVYPQFLVGSISSSQVICYNTIPVGLTGNAPTGGNTSYSYQWQRSSDNTTFNDITGATSLNYAPPALSNTTYYRQVQTSASSCGSLTTNVVTVTVYPRFLAGTITAHQVICYNAVPIGLSGTAPTGGNTPCTYQWQRSPDNITFTNITGATSLNYLPPALTSTTYFRQIQTSASDCGNLTTNVVTITVYSQFLAGTIIANQLICYNTIPAPLTGTAPTGGNTPYSYQWQRSSDNITFTNISGAISLDYSPPALIKTTYYRQVQYSASGCGTLTTNIVVITVYPQFVEGSITASQVICYDAVPTDLAGTAPIGGYTPYSYQWQRSADNISFINVSGATMLNYAPPSLTSTTYYRQTQSSANSCGMLTTNVVTITVFPQFLVGSIAANQAISYNTVPVTLTRTTPTGGSPPYSYQWQSSPDNVTYANIPGATTSIHQPGPLTATTYYRQVQSSANGCSGSHSFTNVVTITVYPNMVAGTIAADQIIYQHTIPAQLTGVAPSGGNPPYFYQWESSDDNVNFFNISGATSINYQPDQLDATTYFRQIQISTSEFSVATNVVTITVTQLPPPTQTLTNIIVANNQEQCYDASQTITIAGGGTTFLVQSGGIVNLIAGQKIYLLAGSKVELSGYLHGYITTSGQYCLNLNIPIPTNPVQPIEETLGITEISSDNTFVCYPNPTAGRFNLWLSVEPGEIPVIVRIYNILGVDVLTRTIYSGKLHQFSLENQAAGIYLVRIVQDGKVGTVIVIRQ